MKKAGLVANQRKERWIGRPTEGLRGGKPHPPQAVTPTYCAGGIFDPSPKGKASGIAL